MRFYSFEFSECVLVLSYSMHLENTKITVDVKLYIRAFKNPRKEF